MKKKVIFPMALLCLFIALAAFKENPKKPLKLKKVFTNSFSYVPNGTVSVDEASTKVSAFFMSKTEVSNAEYREFLNSLVDENLKERYSVKTEEWLEAFKSGEPLAEHYFSHETYSSYPVMNITKESAEAYCNWLTERYASMDIGLEEDMRIVFRLPTRAEWVRAAMGEKAAPYSWGTKYLRNTKGIYLANFNAIGSEHIHKNQETGEFEIVSSVLTSDTASIIQNDMVIYTAPVNDYAAHSYGLMQMNGNVAEMLADSDQAAGGSWRSPGYDIRNESLIPFEEASLEVGFRPIGILTEKQ